MPGSLDKRLERCAGRYEDPRPEEEACQRDVLGLGAWLPHHYQGVVLVKVDNITPAGVHEALLAVPLEHYTAGAAEHGGPEAEEVGAGNGHVDGRDVGYTVWKYGIKWCAFSVRYCFFTDKV